MGQIAYYKQGQMKSAVSRTLCYKMIKHGVVWGCVQKVYISTFSFGGSTPLKNPGYGFSRLFEMIIYWLLTKLSYFYFTKGWKPSANNQICWIIKFSTHSKTFSHFCWKIVHCKAIYWLFSQIQICQKWGRCSYSKLLIILKYWLCCLICAESDQYNFA